MKLINKSQYYMLVGLKVLAKQHEGILQSIQRAVAEIIEEDVNKEGIGGGWAGEFTYTEREVDDILSCAEVMVKDE